MQYQVQTEWANHNWREKSNRWKARENTRGASRDWFEIGTWLVKNACMFWLVVSAFHKTFLGNHET